MVVSMKEAPPSLVEGLDVEPGHGARDGRLRRPRGRSLRAGLAVVLIVAAAGLGWRMLGGSQPDLAAASRSRALIDASTGEVFENYRIPESTSFPLRNPKTGVESLFPAEACYWTAEGAASWSPTWVYVPMEESSAACPDCGREVIPHNPRPPEELMLEALRRHRGG